MAKAGPSTPRKRTQAQREKGHSVQFGELKLAQEEGEEGKVDEEYESSDRELDNNDEQEEEFPEIYADSVTDSNDERSEEELSEDEQILRELAEEEELERDLQESSDSSYTDDEEYDENDPDALNHAVRKAIRRPNEDFDAKDAADNSLDSSKIMGFDTRAYKDKAMIGRSQITGEERWTWKEIAPGWESDEGAEEGLTRVGKIPSYFYDGMPHVGYSIDGKRVMRPAKGDELDKFLASIEDPSSW